MGSNRRVSSHISVILIGRVDGFDKLEQMEIIHANLVTVKEVVAAHISNDINKTFTKSLSKFHTVTRAEHSHGNGVRLNIVQNLLHHDD